MSPHTCSQAETDKQLESYKHEVSRLSSKLGQYSRMGGQPAVVPNWQAPPPPQMMAPPTAAPVVEVAASAGGANPFSGNPVLAGLRSYVESSCNNKVTNNMFSRQIPKQQQM